MARTKSDVKQTDNKKIQADANLFDCYLKVQVPHEFPPGRYALTVNSVRIAREGHCILYVSLEE